MLPCLIPAPHLRIYRTEIFADGTLKKGAETARSNRLYVAGWSLFKILHSIMISKRASKDYTILIHYMNAIPLGVAVFDHGHPMVNVHLFVRKSFRRTGIGSKLMKEAYNLFPDRKIIVNEGIKGSKAFFDRIPWIYKYVDANNVSHYRNKDHA